MSLNNASANLPSPRRLALRTPTVASVRTGSRVRSMRTSGLHARILAAFAVLTLLLVGNGLIGLRSQSALASGSTSLHRVSSEMASDVQTALTALGDIDAAPSDAFDALRRVESRAKTGDVIAADVARFARSDGRRSRALLVTGLLFSASLAVVVARMVSRPIAQIHAAIEQISDVIQTINESQITIASAVEEQTVTTTEMARQLAEAAQGALAISGGSDEAMYGSVVDISRTAHELQSAVRQFTY